MIDKRPFNTLGQHNFGWLDARYHFSFSSYMDRNRMGWGALRVWNDDTIAAGGGFPTHPHQDMEIITYVRKGAITHRDSMGNEGRTKAGDVQVMSAGTGIQHSEFNKESDATRLFQIWITPAKPGGEPRWDQAQFPKPERSGQLTTLASDDPDKRGGLLIRQNARILGANLTEGQTVQYTLAEGRYAYLVVAAGSVDINGVQLDTRDGAAIQDEDSLTITASSDAELVLVDTI
jgi:redox-sensitive bicupin YhaK (pirin superfamily)